MTNGEIIKRYYNGDTFQSIATDAKVSRQRIWQIVKRRCSKTRGGIVFTSPAKRKNPRASEIYIENILDILHIPYEIQGYNSPFDLLLNKKKKIEIKHRRKPLRTSSSSISRYYVFTELKTIEQIDFYIFICGSLENPSIFIVPASEIGYSKSIAEHPRYSTGFHRKYKNNFDLLRSI